MSLMRSEITIIPLKHLFTFELSFCTLLDNLLSTINIVSSNSQSEYLDPGFKLFKPVKNPN